MRMLNALQGYIKRKHMPLMKKLFDFTPRAFQLASNTLVSAVPIRRTVLFNVRRQQEPSKRDLAHLATVNDPTISEVGV